MIDWEEKDLSDLGKIVTGKTPSSSEPAFYGGAIPFVTPSDMDGRRTIDSTARYLTSTGAAKVKSSYIQQPAVCVSCIGSDMGKAVLVDQPFVSNQQINSVIVNDDTERLFVYYNLAGRKDEIRFKASGAAQPIMNKSDFGRLKLSVPDQPTQRTIAFVLGSLDDKIELNRRMNETLEEMARALFRDWFVDFGPTRRQIEGATDPSTIMGNAFPPDKAAELAPLFPAKLGDDGLPEGWLNGVLSDRYMVTIGRTPPRKEKWHFRNDGHGVPWLSIRDLGSCGAFAFDTAETLEETSVASCRVPVVKEDTVLVSFKLTVGRVAIAAKDMATNEAIAHLNSTEQSAPTEYTYAWMKQFDYGTLGSTSSIANAVNSKTIRSMPILCPGQALERSYSDVTSSLFAKIRANSRENQTLAEMRDLLLPKLMSGEIRLKDVEAME